MRARPYRPAMTTQPLATRRQALTGKGLDLMLLASCSCLLTVVCHPVMDMAQATSPSSSAHGAPTTMTTRSNPSTGNWFSAIGQTIPAKRDDLGDEE